MKSDRKDLRSGNYEMLKGSESFKDYNLKNY